MKKRLNIIALSVGLLCVGCGRQKVETTQDLQAVFDSKKADAAVKGGAPEVQVMVKQAVTALENKDQATAVMTLREIRNSPSLTDAQVIAVEDMMKKAYLDLSERAGRGDQQAIASLQMLNMNRR
jgi:hypothetical protein